MIISYWADSEVIWLNISQKQLQDWKKYKWNIWEKTAVKIHKKKKHNLEWLQIQVIMELTQKFSYYKPPQNGPQISTDNIKYYVENDELIVYITDVWWDIEKLLDDYNFKN